jgi:transketolase
MSADKTVQLAINTIRSLAIDAIQKANSGHPGTPLDAAPTAYALWQLFLRYDPDHPDWLNRDRFVLSGGHASMLLYALIHLTGIKAANPSYEKLGREAVSLDDIKNFRQAGSRCPGHPEYGWTSGVESTTGPLGQGLATSVGMAIASRWLAGTYNRPGYDLFHTDITFTEDVAARFLAYGWEVIRVTDPNDIEMLERAYRRFLATSDRPTLIVVHSHIGYGAPHKQDSPSAHGEPLGPEEVRLTKEFFGFSPDETFVVPPGVREHFAATMGARGSRLFEEWEQLFARYRAQYPDLANQIECLRQRELRNEGVGHGRAEAEKIVKDARADAQTTLSKAREEADQIVSRARSEATNLEKAGRQALEVAARDTVLDLKNRLSQRVAREVKHLVNEEVQREEILEKLILEVAGKAREKTVGPGPVEVLLPEKIVSMEDIAKDPAHLQASPLGRFASLVTSNMLRQGVTLNSSPNVKAGIKVRLTDKGIDLDLSDNAIADLLMQHLQPRFQALLEGIV